MSYIIERKREWERERVRRTGTSMEYHFVSVTRILPKYINMKITKYYIGI
jgi:hypothetical protein